MSVSKMERLTVVCARDDADALLRRLTRLAAVSLIDTTEEQTKYPPPTGDVIGAAARLARVEAVLPVLAKRSVRKTRLFPERTKVAHAKFCQDGRYEVAWKVVAQTEKILEKQKTLASEREALLAEMQSYTPYLDDPQRLDLKGTKQTQRLLGMLPGGTSVSAVLEALEGHAAVGRVICEDTTGLYLSVLVHEAERDATVRALSAIGFLQASFSRRDGTAKELFDRADHRRKEIDEACEGLETRLGSLATRLSEVEVLYDVEKTTLQTEQQKQKLIATKDYTVLCAWCPVQYKERVTHTLQKAQVAFEFEEPAEGEDVPVLLHNNAFARNFEWVVGMYSYPAYGKFDPTFVMSIFYMLIFGLMFADAGYGLVLSLACFLLVRYTHPREGMKRFLLMFGYCGLSCILFGILFGSYFGNFPIAFLESFLGLAPEQLPNLSLLPAEAANVAVLFDPLQNPMGFLIVSLGVGAVHLLGGMAVQGFLLCKKGKVLDAIFDIGSYWLLFAGIGALALGTDVGLWLTLGGVGAILLTQGRHKKGLFGKLIGGFGGLYSLINFASDLLSYSRILALGLASAVVGQVVNILATLKGAGVVGFILMIVVFCVGHLLNLVINVLGTFVHTARLQYIEFFGKFYEDGGTPFRPLSTPDRYSEDTTSEESESVIQN